MKCIMTPFKGLFVIEGNSFKDFRGSFNKLFNKMGCEEHGLISEFKDLNHSMSLKKGTFRGFHYQISPFEEAKVISCLQGEIQDYAIDIRKGSDTYLKVYSIKLNQNENKIVYIPNGFAHGYMALEDNSQVIYLSSNYHSSKHERQINPLDPYFNLNYAHKPILSEKDEQAEFISYLP